AALGGVYDRLVSEVTAEARASLVIELSGALRGGPSSTLALVPILQREQDAGVARAAALALATSLPAAPDDPLAGRRAPRGRPAGAPRSHRARRRPRGPRGGAAGAGRLPPAGAPRRRLAPASAGGRRRPDRAPAEMVQRARDRVAVGLDGGRRAHPLRRAGRV